MSLLQNMIGNAAEKENGLLTPKNVRLLAGVFCVLCLLAALFLTDGVKFLLGLILGGGIAQLVFLQNQKSLEKIVAQKDPVKAEFISRRDYYIRMALRAAALVIGYFNPYTNLLAVILGLMSIAAAIYLLTFLSAGKMKKEGAKSTENEAPKEETK